VKALVEKGAFAASSDFSRVAEADAAIICVPTPAVLIATNHASVNYNELAVWSHCIVDTRNAMDGIDMNDDQLWKA